MLDFMRQLLEGITSPYYVCQILPYHLAMLAVFATGLVLMGKGGGR